MQPEQTVPRHGRPPSPPRPISAHSDGEPMRGAHPRHAEVVETPQEPTRARGGVARSGLDAGTTLAVSLPLEARAPGAARVVVECLCGRLPRTVLEDVRLV